LVNAQAQIRPDYSRAQTNAECRRDAALRDIRQRYADLYQRLTARMQMEQTRVQREFLQGKFDR
jgi:hypothetical protein